MKRLMRYFVISLFLNIVILVFLFLPQNKPKSKLLNSGVPDKGFSIIPAKLLPDLNESRINESLNNRKFRPLEIDKNVTREKKDRQEGKIKSNNHVKVEEVVEIPDSNKKKNQFLSPDEYQEFKKSLPLQGTIVTEMRVNFPENITDETIKEIISFFGFKIVAYPTHNPDHLLVCKAPEFRFERLDTQDQLQEFYRNNSNRTIEPENGLLYWARSELTKQNINSESLKISLVLGNSSGYFHWKEILAARSSSKLITDVNYTEAKISKTPQGYWLLLVESITLKDGQNIKIEDEELQEIIL